MSLAPEPVPAVVTALSTRKGFRFGLVTLIFSIIAPAWVILSIIFVVTSAGHDLPGQQIDTAATPLDVLRYLFVLSGYLLVPLMLISAIVFGIVALLRNRKPGVILAATGFGVLVLCVIGIIAVVAWIFNGIATVS